MRARVHENIYLRPGEVGMTSEERLQEGTSGWKQHSQTPELTRMTLVHHSLRNNIVDILNVQLQSLLRVDSAKTTPRLAQTGRNRASRITAAAATAILSIEARIQFTARGTKRIPTTSGTFSQA